MKLPIFCNKLEKYFLATFRFEYPLCYIKYNNIERKIVDRIHNVCLLNDDRYIVIFDMHHKMGMFPLGIKERDKFILSEVKKESKSLPNSNFDILFGIDKIHRVEKYKTLNGTSYIFVTDVGDFIKSLNNNKLKLCKIKTT